MNFPDGDRVPLGDFILALSSSHLLGDAMKSIIHFLFNLRGSLVFVLVWLFFVLYSEVLEELSGFVYVLV